MRIRVEHSGDGAQIGERSVREHTVHQLRLLGILSRLARRVLIEEDAVDVRADEIAVRRLRVVRPRRVQLSRARIALRHRVALVWIRHTENLHAVHRFVGAALRERVRVDHVDDGEFEVGAVRGAVQSVPMSNNVRTDALLESHLFHLVHR